MPEENSISESPSPKIDVDQVTGDIPYTKEEYVKLAKEFRIESIDALLKKLPDPHFLYTREVVFGHRDLDPIIDCMIKHKPFAVVTGANPSGSLHFGNKLFLDQALYFQKHGAEVFIPISNDETYVFRKSKSVEDATRTAMEIVIPEIIAMGFDSKKTKIFLSTKTPEAYELAVTLSARTTFSTIKAIFGFTNETPPGQIFYGVMQSAHILLPQLKRFGGPKPVVVPIGIDQDPYMRLARDIAEKVGLVKPSSTYHMFMHGLRGGKMSGSKPETCIYLSDKPEIARKKIMSAKTGGRGTVEEQRRLGANPHICNVFEYYKFHLAETEKYLARVRTECETGKRICGDCKAECAQLLMKFLEKYAKARDRVKDKIDEFFLRPE